MRIHPGIFLCQCNCNVLFCSFSYDGRWKQKLQTSVDFPLENLDLSQYVIGPKNNLKKYNLFSVSVSISLNWRLFVSKQVKKKSFKWFSTSWKSKNNIKLWNYWHILNNWNWIDFSILFGTESLRRTGWRPLHSLL